MSEVDDAMVELFCKIAVEESNRIEPDSAMEPPPDEKVKIRATLERFLAALSTPVAQPETAVRAPQFNQAEFDEMTRKGAVAWAGVNPSDLRGAPTLTAAPDTGAVPVAGDWLKASLDLIADEEFIDSNSEFSLLAEYVRKRAVEIAAKRKPLPDTSAAPSEGAGNGGEAPSISASANGVTANDLSNLIEVLTEQWPIAAIKLRGYVEYVAALKVSHVGLRNALLECARMADALKMPCSEDPESWQAIRNGQYASISQTAHIALGTISGPQAPDDEMGALAAAKSL